MWGMLARRASRQQGEEAGRLLYLQAVAAARKPHFYRAGGVPDTLDGRFDMICLMAALLVRRLRRTAPALAQSVFDAMFRDMDASLRELGVGDLGVPRRVGAMWQAFNGRCHAYEAALQVEDRQLLSDCLARNIWRGSPPDEATVGRLAREAIALDRALAQQSDAELIAGRVLLEAGPA
ncbi:ubiquinol-cytochrome C chaperone family protein [Lichenicoccus roseus]|nr:ubiquinol-cytochrome C chaperone family protein [Lichenicoccus roseus]